MKNTIMVLTWMICFILMWLLFSVIGYVVSDETFKECLRSEKHIVGLIFCYWWMPSFFILSDLDEKL